MRFGKKDYKALVALDTAVAKIGAAPSSEVGDDVETMAVLPCVMPGQQATLPSPSCTSFSSAWDKTSPTVL